MAGPILSPSQRPNHSLEGRASGAQTRGPRGLTGTGTGRHAHGREHKPRAAEAPRPGRPVRAVAVAEGQEPLRAPGPPPRAWGRELYFREFSRIINGATFSVPNRPAPSRRARVSRSIPKMESSLSMRTPLEVIYMFYI